MGNCSKPLLSVCFVAPFCLFGVTNSFSGDETRVIGGSDGGLSDGVRGRFGGLLVSSIRDVYKCVCCSWVCRVVGGSKECGWSEMGETGFEGVRR